MTILRTVFLSLHAASGVLGLVLGAFAFRLPETRDFRPWFARAYAATLVSLTVLLSATVVLDWTRISTMQQVVYAVLVGLAVVIVTRIFLGLRAAAGRPAGWREKYLNHVYFTYISLWEGFFIVGLIDLDAPGWLVGAVAVGVVVLGAAVFNRYKSSVLAGTSAEVVAS
jgi:hypothetical protein